MGQFAYGYAFSFLTALIVLFGDYLIKLAADADHPVLSRLVLGGVVLYGASALLWYAAVRHVTLAQAGVAFSMFSLLCLSAIGVLFFEERIYPREAAGLGLALVRKLVRDMNGSISHERDAKRAMTRFRVHLPLAKTDAAKSEGA